MPANVLITSISKKVPLIEAVRKAVGAISAIRPNCIEKIYGGDSNFHCIGRYFVDEFWHMPFQEILTVEELIGYCNKHQIKMIIPTRDDELPYFAKNAHNLEKHGISCMISNPMTIDVCRDKLLFYEFLRSHNIPAIPTYTHLDSFKSSSYVVKECFGAGAKSMGLDLSRSQAKEWAEKLRFPIFQPFIRGIEYSVDLYINKQGEPMGTIARARELIENGESQITGSVKMPDLESLCIQTAKAIELYGAAVFQILRDDSKHLHLIECNPRFGGASSLSLAMGLRTFEWFFQESLGLPLTPFNRSPTELRQVRYPEDLIIPQ